MGMGRGFRRGKDDFEKYLKYYRKKSLEQNINEYEKMQRYHKTHAVTDGGEHFDALRQVISEQGGVVNIGKKTRLSNTNDMDEATEVSEGFHGRSPTYIEDVIEIEKYRTKLAHLGDLVEFEILDSSGRKVTPINFDEHDSEEHVSVGSTPERNQIILSGGNQAIDLDSLEDLSDSEKEKDLVEIGIIYSISYYTDKHHLEGPAYQKKGTEYIHVFGEEEGGEKPILVYDRLNQRMMLVGGSYEVRDEGIYN